MLAWTTESPVLLIGSAHVVDLERPLTQALTERVLDAVALELDDERAATVLAEAPPDHRRGGPLMLRIWGRLQERLGAELGSGSAGAEMRTAARVARSRGLPIFLIDDPIRQTIPRLIRAMSPKERISLVVGGLLGLVLPSRFVARQLDDYAAAPQDYLEQIRSSYPGIARVLLDERNEHMAGRLEALRRRGFGRVAAVVGDAHLPGLAEALKRRGIPTERLSFGELRGGAIGAAPA